jgi:hypothetical protein
VYVCVCVCVCVCVRALLRPVSQDDRNVALAVTVITVFESVEYLEKLIFLSLVVILTMAQVHEAIHINFFSARCWELTANRQLRLFVFNSPGQCCALAR